MSITETFSAAEISYRRDRIASDFARVQAIGSSRRTRRIRRHVRSLSGGTYRPADARS